MSLLTAQEISERLETLDGWEVMENEITKSFKLKNFIESIGFINKIAILSEKADHHPDILILYNKVKITLSTHSEGGLTTKDFDLASEIENL